MWSWFKSICGGTSEEHWFKGISEEVWYSEEFQNKLQESEERESRWRNLEKLPPNPELRASLDRFLVKTNGWTDLHLAIYRNNIDYARKLIDQGTNLKCVDNDGYDAYALAILYKRTEIVQIIGNVIK